MYAPIMFIGIIASLLCNVRANGQNMPKAWFGSEPGQPGSEGDYSKNPVYNVGDTVTFRWTSTFTKTGIVMWQEGANPANSLSLLSDTSDKSVAWKVTKDWMKNIKSSQAGIAFLGLYESGSTTMVVKSHSFNITGTEEADSSVSSVQSSTAETTTAQGKSTTANTKTSTVKTTVATTSAAVNSAATATNDAPTTILMTAAETSATSPADNTSSAPGLSSKRFAGLSLGYLLLALAVPLII